MREIATFLTAFFLFAPSLFAASLEDFTPASVTNETRAVVGSVRVYDSGTEVTESCRICFRGGLGECYQLPVKGVVYLAMSPGMQAVSTLICPGKIPERSVVRGFQFPVDPRHGVGTYFGSVTLDGEFGDGSPGFRVVSVEDQYAQDAGPFHRIYGSRMGLRYARNMARGGSVPIHTTAQKRSFGRPENAKKNEPLQPLKPRKKSWYVNIGGIYALSTTHSGDAAIIQENINTIKSISGAKESKFGSQFSLLFPMSKTPLMLGPYFRYLSQSMTASPYKMAINTTELGATGRYYFNPDFRAFFVHADLGLSRLVLNYSDSSGVTDDKKGSTGIGFALAAGAGYEFILGQSMRFGPTLTYLKSSLPSDGQTWGVSSFLLSVHLGF